MSLYSIKMRASRLENNESSHISGAERIVQVENLEDCIVQLTQRALNHSKGKAENIYIKIEKVDYENITYRGALSVKTIEVEDKTEGMAKMLEVLKCIGVENGEGILKLIPEAYSMRGAMLLDVDTLERLEEDKKKGIRATYMDYEKSSESGYRKTSQKEHFKEALVLATKVAYSPYIIGEICISDDPEYVTGYIASKKIGYIRITKLKEQGDDKGGRIFLYRGPREAVKECIEYIEKAKVLIKRNTSNE